MRKHFVLMILFVIVGAIGIAQTPPQPLKIYFIDVEGGQATLIATWPSRSMWDWSGMCLVWISVMRPPGSAADQ